MTTAEQHPIEVELLKATKAKPFGSIPKEDRADYLARLIRAAADLHDSKWSKLTDDTQSWVNRNIELMNLSKESPQTLVLEEFDEGTNADAAETDIDELESDAEGLDADAPAASAEDDDDTSDDDEDEPEEDDEESDEEEEARLTAAPTATATVSTSTRTTVRGTPPKTTPAPAVTPVARPTAPKTPPTPIARPKPLPTSSADATPAPRPVAAALPKKKGTGFRFRELAIDHPEANLEALLKMLEDEGLIIAESTAQTMLYEVRAALEILRARGRLLPPKKGK